jgi:GrpB-like predicted nucleotidyltransferase (UPF0157 family)
VIPAQSHPRVDYLTPDNALSKQDRFTQHVLRQFPETRNYASNMTTPPLVIVDYSPGWPREFEREREAIKAALAPLSISIEHIGSTSVPGMRAKPIIDIMVGGPSLDAFEERIQDLARIGYEHLPEMRSLMPDNRFFAKPATLPRRFNLHAVELDGEFWRDHLLFRDMLRADVQLATEYAELKSELATQFASEPKQYTLAKGPFINAVVQRMLHQDL